MYFDPISSRESHLERGVHVDSRIPIAIGERIAAIRTRKAEDRARARAKAGLRAQREANRRSAKPRHSADAPARPGRSRRRRSKSARTTRAA